MDDQIPGAIHQVTKVLPSYLHLRALRWSLSVTSLEGKYPLIVTGGKVSIGERLAIRGTQGQVEIGSVSGGELMIGIRVFINWGSTIVAYTGISIGDNCRIGELTAIFDTDHHATEPGTAVRKSRISKGHNVWIGRGSIVLPGVEIGDNAVIAAGSLVNSNFPPNTLVEVIQRA